MANTTITARYTAGLTLTAKVYPQNSETIDEEVTLTEGATRVGYYTGTLTAASSGLRDLELWDASNKIADLYIEVVDDTGTYAAYESPALATITAAIGVAPTVTQIRTEIDSNSTQLAAILLDTGELQTDWLNGGRLDLILDATATQASITALNDPTAAGIADAVWDEATTGHVTAGTFGEQLKTDVDAILVDTTEIGAAGAGLTALATAAALTTVDTVVDAIAVSVGTISGLSSITVVTAVSGNTVTVYAKDTWTFSIISTALTLTDYEVLAFSVKSLAATETDAGALLYLRSDTGLEAIGGAVPISAANGTLTADSATQFTAQVEIAETAVTPGGYKWWLKGFDTTPAPDTGTTLATGVFSVIKAGVQAVE